MGKNEMKRRILVDLLLRNSGPTKGDAPLIARRTKNVVELRSRDTLSDRLSEMLVLGARRLRAAAVEAEL